MWAALSVRRNGEKMVHMLKYTILDTTFGLHLSKHIYDWIKVTLDTLEHTSLARRDLPRVQAFYQTCHCLSECNCTCPLQFH